jgi:hypothetical protein
VFLHLSVGLLTVVTEVQQQQENITHTTTTLSQARTRHVATSSGELVFFGGGFNTTGAFDGPGIASDRVDIYNVTSGNWTTATLSIPRGDLAATSSQNLVFFAGGWNRPTEFNQVDIYNVTSGNWTTTTLSRARWGFAATSVRDLVLFGGGFSTIVDIYNITNNTWTTATLSQERHFPAAVSVNNRYALFAGGYGSGAYSNTIDVYDVLTGIWNKTLPPMSVPREGLASVSYGDLVILAGGATNFGCTSSSDAVDIYNMTSKTHSTFTLSISRCYPAAAVLKNLIFIGGGGDLGITYKGDIDNITSFDRIDIYDVISNNWSIATLSQTRAILVAATSFNQIIFGGGQFGVQTSNFVDIFQIPQLLSPTSFSPIESPVLFQSVPASTSNSSYSSFLTLILWGVSFL